MQCHPGSQRQNSGLNRTPSGWFTQENHGWCREGEQGGAEKAGLNTHHCAGLNSLILPQEERYGEKSQSSAPRNQRRS